MGLEGKEVEVGEGGADVEVAGEEEVEAAVAVAAEGEEGEEVVESTEGGKGVTGRTRIGTRPVRGTIIANAVTTRRWRGLAGRRKWIGGYPLWGCICTRDWEMLCTL